MKWLFLVLLLISCNDNSKSLNGDAEPPRLVLNDPDAFDVNIIEWTPIDAEVDAGCCGIPCHCGEEYERQQRCWQQQMFYCTPTGAPPGDDPTLYQQAIIMDICNEAGEPCTPQGPNDQECSWTIVDMGDCEGWLECDPTDPDPYVQTDVPCTAEDENGEVYTGLQDFFCQKGKIITTPCEPCEPEQCDGIDNDCDTIIDEGEYPCESECGAGNAICVMGELVGCDAPLSFPEVCNGEDDDCDGDTDEELIQECHTACEAGVEFCVEGIWTGCTAQPPLEEECNGQDDDCDGLTDEGLDCACPPEMIGFLMPCMEDPLVCGQGFKTCECVDEECSSTQMTQCLAMCSWMPPNGEPCDPTLGAPTMEICNNFDDDCDEAIDEDLVTDCYTGPDGTVNVGVCVPGQLICQAGAWGNEFEGLFVEDMCLGEKTPLEEDLCTGNDDNCDGVIDKVMEETDILFIVDTSGSMSSTINAVQNAMSMFSVHYSDQEVIQWGLVIGPVDTATADDTLVMATNLVPFQQFLPVLANIDDDSTSEEMLYDALFLSIRNLVPIVPLNWNQFFWREDIGSNPSVENWSINWRPDANHVVIIFTDEEGQSYTNPEINQELILEAANSADDLAIYTFTKQLHQNGDWGWLPVSVNGECSDLTSNSNQMFNNLMEIIEEEACGGDVQEASLLKYPLNPLLYPISRTQEFYPASYLGFLKLESEQNEVGQTDEMWIHIPTQQCIHPTDLHIE